MLVSETPSIHSVEKPSRKRRRTILESFQTMSLVKHQDSSDEGNSSCATGGSLNGEGGDDDDDESLNSRENNLMLSDQERFHRAIMYQLATGNPPRDHADIVEARVEQMIRQSRLQAAHQDDFHVEFDRGCDDEMNVDAPLKLKRSHSLPRDFEGPSSDPPIDMVEVPSRLR